MKWLIQVLLKEALIYAKQCSIVKPSSRFCQEWVIISSRKLRVESIIRIPVNFMSKIGPWVGLMQLHSLIRWQEVFTKVFVIPFESHSNLIGATAV